MNAKLIVAGILIPLALMAQDAKTTQSDQPLTDDQVAVYKVFLSKYLAGDGDHAINLADQTTPLKVDREMDGRCVSGTGTSDIAEVHPLDAKLLGQSGKIHLIDLKKARQQVKKNDPDNTMKQGKPAQQAVEDAFAAGYLWLSEVSVSQDGRWAVMSFGFHCGTLCGHGGTLVFEKTDGVWKESSRTCSRWIS